MSTFVLRQTQTTEYGLRRTVVAGIGYTPGDYITSSDFDSMVAITREEYDTLKANGQTAPRTLYVLVVPEP